MLSPFGHEGWWKKRSAGRFWTCSENFRSISRVQRSFRAEFENSNPLRRPIPTNAFLSFFISMSPTRTVSLWVVIGASGHPLERKASKTWGCHSLVGENTRSYQNRRGQTRNVGRRQSDFSSETLFVKESQFEKASGGCRIYLCGARKERERRKREINY